MIKLLIDSEVNVKKARIGVLGITFKEDCPDARNSKVDDVIKELNTYGIEPIICDPVADKEDAEKFYNIKLHDINDLTNLDCLIIAVAHNEFKQISNENIKKMFKENCKKPILVDIKGIKDRKEFISLGYTYWRL